MADRLGRDFYNEAQTNMMADGEDAAQTQIADQNPSSASDVDRNLPDGAALALAAFILSICVWIVYGRILHQPFIFDDRASVLENTSIKRLRPLLGDDSPLNSRNEVIGRRPLANLSLAINYRFGGLNPAGYHAYSIVVHIATALLLGLVISRTLRLPFFDGRFADVAGPLALLVALVWALHPLVTESVAYVTQRTELMMAFCYLATLYSSLRYWEAQAPGARRTWLLLATVSCLLGVGSKEVIVTAPVMVLLFERTFVAGSFRRSLRDSWPLYVGLMLSWGWLVALGIYGPRYGTAGFGRGVPVLPYWATQAQVLLMYLKLCFWPWPLVIHYDVPLVDSVPTALRSVLPVAALAVATLVLLARRTAAGFLGACVFAILSPTLVIPMSDEIAAERRMYLPLAAIVSLTVVGGYVVAQKIVRKFATDRNGGSTGWAPLGVTATCAVLVVAIFGLMSSRRLTLYSDDVALWQDAVLYQPHDWMTQANLASALNNADRPKEAIEHHLEALRLQPGRPELHYKFGIALGRAGRLNDAMEQYREALRMNPNSAPYHHELGAALLNAGKSDQAIEEFRETLRIDPQAIDSRNFLATAMLNAGRPQEAIEQFEQVLKVLPDAAPVQRKLALALAMTGQSEAAVRQYEQSLRGAQDTPVERFFLGHALAGAGKTQDAIVEFKNALGLAPDAVQVRYELALALAKLGRDPEAIDQFERVIRSQSKNVAAHIQLAGSYAKVDRLADAIAVAEKGLKSAQSQALPEQAEKIEALLIDFRSRLQAP